MSNTSTLKTCVHKDMFDGGTGWAGGVVGLLGIMELEGKRADNAKP